MRLASLTLWVALASACSRAGDESQAKRAPIAPPPSTVALPADLRIAVQIDGVGAPELTASRLQAIHPDFADEEHQAWRLGTLVPAFERDGATIEARGPSGVSLRLDHPASAQAPQPVLFLTRRGDVAVSLVDPANPFPDYHGQGGRLKRGGDPMPKLSPVVALSVTGH
ncbi:MAG: hypothetical protein K8W52_43100 [Deltaproteobacteria bacterium]|nr:hypothetical protein [Deltaproteobacteria bacterium]